MTSDEIRKLAESNAIVRFRCRGAYCFPKCREWCPSSDLKKCRDADDIRAALLEYAAMKSDSKTEYVVARRIDEEHVVYYEAKYATPEEAREAIPPGCKNYFVASRTVTDFKEFST